MSTEDDDFGDFEDFVSAMSNSNSNTNTNINTKDKDNNNDDGEPTVGVGEGDDFDGFDGFDGFVSATPSLPVSLSVSLSSLPAANNEEDSTNNNNNDEDEFADFVEAAKDAQNDGKRAEIDCAFAFTSHNDTTQPPSNSSPLSETSYVFVAESEREKESEATKAEKDNKIDPFSAFDDVASNESNAVCESTEGTESAQPTHTETEETTRENGQAHTQHSHTETKTEEDDKNDPFSAFDDLASSENNVACESSMSVITPSLTQETHTEKAEEACVPSDTKEIKTETVGEIDPFSAFDDIMPAAPESVVSESCVEDTHSHTPLAHVEETEDVSVSVNATETKTEAEGEIDPFSAFDDIVSAPVAVCEKDIVTESSVVCESQNAEKEALSHSETTSEQLTTTQPAHTKAEAVSVSVSVTESVCEDQLSHTEFKTTDNVEIDPFSAFDDIVSPAPVVVCETAVVCQDEAVGVDNAVRESSVSESVPEKDDETSLSEALSETVHEAEQAQPLSTQHSHTEANTEEDREIDAFSAFEESATVESEIVCENSGECESEVAVVSDIHAANETVMNEDVTTPNPPTEEVKTEIDKEIDPFSAFDDIGSTPPAVLCESENSVSLTQARTPSDSSESGAHNSSKDAISSQSVLCEESEIPAHHTHTEDMDREIAPFSGLDNFVPAPAVVCESESTLLSESSESESVDLNTAQSAHTHPILTQNETVSEAVSETLSETLSEGVTTPHNTKTEAWREIDPFSSFDDISSPAPAAVFENFVSVTQPSDFCEDVSESVCEGVTTQQHDPMETKTETQGEIDASSAFDKITSSPAVTENNVVVCENESQHTLTHTEQEEDFGDFCEPDTHTHPHADTAVCESEVVDTTQPAHTMVEDVSAKRVCEDVTTEIERETDPFSAFDEVAPIPVVMEHSVVIEASVVCEGAPTAHTLTHTEEEEEDFEDFCESITITQTPADTAVFESESVFTTQHAHTLTETVCEVITTQHTPTETKAENEGEIDPFSDFEDFASAPAPAVVVGSSVVCESVSNVESAESESLTQDSLPHSVAPTSPTQLPLTTDTPTTPSLTQEIDAEEDFEDFGDFCEPTTHTHSDTHTDTAVCEREPTLTTQLAHSTTQQLLEDRENDDFGDFSAFEDAPSQDALAQPTEEATQPTQPIAVTHTQQSEDLAWGEEEDDFGDFSAFESASHAPTITQNASTSHHTAPTQPEVISAQSDAKQNNAEEFDDFGDFSAFDETPSVAPTHTHTAAPAAQNAPTQFAEDPFGTQPAVSVSASAVSEESSEEWDAFSAPTEPPVNTVTRSERSEHTLTGVAHIDSQRERLEKELSDSVSQDWLAGFARMRVISNSLFSNGAPCCEYEETHTLPHTNIDTDAAFIENLFRSPHAFTEPSPTTTAVTSVRECLSPSLTSLCEDVLRAHVPHNALSLQALRVTMESVSLKNNFLAARSRERKGRRIASSAEVLARSQSQSNEEEEMAQAQLAEDSDWDAFASAPSTLSDDESSKRVVPSSNNTQTLTQAQIQTQTRTPTAVVPQASTVSGGETASLSRPQPVSAASPGLSQSAMDFLRTALPDFSYIIK